jgi:hypothetical protein
MRTTNTASAGMLSTYSDITERCAELLEIAGELESIARQDRSFLENGRFRELSGQLHTTLTDLAGESQVIPLSM